MHLLALSWDVDRPGRLDPQVHGLVRALRDHGATCEVVALGTAPAATRHMDGVPVTWVAEAPPVLPDTAEYDLARVLALATRATAAAERRCQRRIPDVVLAAGWATAYTATAVRATHGVPIVAMLDALAADGGDLDDTARLVAQVEWWLTYEARCVTTGTEHARRALRSAFRLPAGKVEVIPRGVDPIPVAVASERRDGPDACVVATADMVATVRAALGPRACSADPDDVTRSAVVAVMDDHAPDLVLRAMAAGAAVVVPDDGPLRELVHARRSGVRVGRDARSLRDAVVDLVRDVSRRGRLGRQAQQRVATRHDWHTIARQHLSIAARAVHEEDALHRSAGPATPLRPLMLRAPLLRLVGDAPRPDGPRQGTGEPG